MQHDPTGQPYSLGSVYPHKTGQRKNREFRFYSWKFNNKKRESYDWPNFLYIAHCGWAISWEKGFYNGSEEDWWNKENIQNKYSRDLLFLLSHSLFFINRQKYKNSDWFLSDHMNRIPLGVFLIEDQKRIHIGAA